MDDHEMKNCRKCGDLYDMADIVGFTVHQQGACLIAQRDALRVKLADEVTAHARTCVKLHAAEAALAKAKRPLSRTVRPEVSFDDGEDLDADGKPYCMACEFAYGHAGPCPRRDDSSSNHTEKK